MTKKLKEFWPDEAHEWHLIAKYVNHLGTSMSAVLLFSADKWWVLASLLLTWLGASAADYFGHKDKAQNSPPPHQ
jgi:hypothetical protein